MFKLQSFLLNFHGEKTTTVIFMMTCYDALMTVLSYR